MGIFRLGSLTVVLSDQLISGFSTGAACHVAVSQMKDLFGIHVGRYSGPLKLIYVSVFCFLFSYSSRLIFKIYSSHSKILHSIKYIFCD